MDLLLFGAELQQCWSKHPDAEAVERRAAAKLGHFLTQNLCFLRRKASAAISLGPIRHGVSLGDARFEPQFLRLGLKNEIASAPADIFVTLRRRAHFGGAVFFQPGAGLGAECFKVGHDDLLFNCLMKFWAVTRRNASFYRCVMHAVTSFASRLTGRVACLA